MEAGAEVTGLEEEEIALLVILGALVVGCVLCFIGLAPLAVPVILVPVFLTLAWLLDGMLNGRL